MRVIRTCKEMGIKTVAVYSTADKDSLPVRFADEAVCIGPAVSSKSYLSISNIIAAAEITNSDAIHPGYGFLSENEKFSRVCQEYGIKFIGALPEQIAAMGDKATAKATMIKAGVPCIPGSEGLLKDIEDAKVNAERIKYPVILKATAGGGGKGMRIVWKEEDLQSAWDSARQEAGAAFGVGAREADACAGDCARPEFVCASASGGDRGGGVGGGVCVSAGGAVPGVCGVYAAGGQCAAGGV